MSRRLPELVFIDPAVSDIGVLAAGLRPEVAPFVLEPEIPALSRIADILEEFGQPSAVHVIAHGEPGVVAFSNGPVSSETIASNSPAFQKISQALGGTGQLLLWSCESGQGVRGTALLSALTNATGAQVAAATGRVGSAAQGGRWELDVCPAGMQAPLPLTSQGAASYPAVMQITKAKLGSITTDTGSSSTDFITDDQSLVLSGTVTGKTGNVLYIWLSGGAFGSGTLVGQVTLPSNTANQSWSYDLTTSGVVSAHSLADGTYTVTLNKSSTKIGRGVLATQTLIEDTTAPATPVTPSLTPASDSGLSNTDGITNVTTPAFTGTAEAGSTVTVYSDGVAVGSAVATGGSYSITSSALAAGTHSITVKATDTAGNVSSASASLSVTIDTTAPSAPSTPSMSAASDSGASSSDHITNGVTPVFTGTAESGSAVTIYSDGVAVGSGVATSGSYSITTSALAAGTHSITSKATDTAGNVSAASGALSVTIDTTAPAAPSVPDLAAASDTGASNTDNITSVTTPVFAGTAEAGSTVTIYSDGVAVGSGTATGGNYSITTSTLSQGLHVITATAADTAGNVSAATSGLEVTIDNTVPSAPSAPDMALASDSGSSNTDNITNVTTLAFTGTAEAGSTVTIYSDGTAVGSSVATGGSYSITTSALAAGTHSITAKAADTAGNVSAASSALSVTIDTTAPAAPSTPDMTAASDDGVSNTDNITDISTPTFTGTAEAGSTVTLYSDGTAVGSGIATGGTYTIAASSLSVGTHSITAKATDAAGNTSVASSGLSVTILTPPALVPSIPDLAASSDSGTSSTDNITNNATPTFTGTAPSGSAVTIYSDGVAVGTGTASVGGSYSIATSALSDGTHTITAGDSSGTSSGLQVTIDRTAPSAPSVPDLSVGSDSGLSNTDNITNVTTLSFAGTAEAGSTVTIYSDGVAVGTGVATGGSYGITTSALGAGTHSITATATDVAGNTSAVSSSSAVTIDTTAPAAPSAPKLTAASDSGASSTDNITNITAPSFTGSAEAGSTVTIYSDGVAVGSGVATGGTYTITTSVLAAGAHSITAKAADAAGNVSAASSGLSITIDTTAPSAPSAPALTTASDSGTSSTDDVTNVATPTVTGTAETGSTVTIYRDGVAVGSGVATGGSYSIVTSRLADGVHSITAKATDAAGNQSVASSGLSVTIDTTAPSAPSAPSLATASDSGSLNDDDLTNVTTPTFTGTAEAGSTVTIYSDGVAVGSGVATNGSYSVTASTLASGTHTITAKATDLSGNVSAASSGLAVTIDTTPPAAPSAPSMSAASDLGSSSTDGITCLATPTFTGTAEAGSTVTIYSDGVAVGSGVATGGSYAVTVSALSEGTHSITAKATDMAGNVGSASTALSATIDLTAPATSSTPDLIAASDSGTSSTDNITNVTTPTFSGTAEAGSTVTIYSDGVAVGSGVATGGNYSVTTSALADGAHNITAIATDVAGNDGTESAALAVTIDSLAPTLAVTGISPDSGTSSSDGITTAGTVTVSGTIDVADAALSVTVLRDGTSVGTATVNQTTGVWSLANVALTEGTHTLTARATDVAGNAGTSGTFTAIKDSTAPAAPSVPDMTNASDSGNSSTDNITSVTTPTFTGSAEAGSTVTIYSDGVAVGSGIATGGSYSIVTSVLADGTHSITAKATDAAGNVSAASAGLSVTIDTAAPAAPSAPDLIASADSGASSIDNITNITVPTFTGSAEAGSTVTIYSDGVAVGSGVATGGSYSITTSVLADGTHNITGQATDVAGNVGAASSALAVTIDATAPAAPSGPVLSAASDSGASNSDNVTNVATATFTGTAEAGSTVTIYSDGVSVGSGVATNGSYSIATSALADGTHSITAKATDAAGNVSAVSAGLSVTIDTTSPAAPSAPDLIASADSGASSTDNITNVTTPTFTGSAEAGSTVTIFSDGVAVGSGVATGGTYSITTSVLADGTHNITAQATDVAGNAGPVSSALAVTIDAMAPAAPSGPVLSAASDSGTSNTDNVTNVAAPTFTGTAEAGSTVTIYSDGIAVGSGVAAGGSYAVTVSALSEGTHNIIAKATDLAGNVGPASTALAVTIDLTAPASPSAPDLIAASDSGSSSADDITNVAAATFSGTAEAGSTVTIYSDGVAVGSGIATGGSYSIVTSVLADGTHGITAKATDPAGNVSAASAGLSVTIDTTVPAAPSAPDLIASDDSGASSTDNITSVTAPTFTGSAETGSTVTIYSDGVAVGSGVATGGTYSIGTSTLTDGTHNITAQATDVAGNVGAASSPLTVTIDTTAPTVAIGTIAGDDILTGTEAAAGFAISGTTSGAEAGQAITVNVLDSANTVIQAYVTTAGSGTWSVNETPAQAQALARGTYTVTADVTDVAGNAAPEASQSLSVVCYLEGTAIRTPLGDVAVEALVPGDMVVTASGEKRMIKWIGHRRIDLARHPRPDLAAPVRIQRGAINDGVPHKDLLVSPDHGIYLDGYLICARQLINGTTIRQEITRQAVTYYHVELESHDLLLAEGLAAESYLDTGNRGLFSNGGVPLVLHPDLVREADVPLREAGSCVPFAWEAERVQPVWQRLMERAAVLGQPIPNIDTTTDPKLRILADGVEVQSVHKRGKHLTFLLPSGCHSVRLNSRAARPTEARPWLDDRRTLGVRVDRIRLRGMTECVDVPMDHPGLADGWWSVERDGAMLHRWTNGDAVLALPPMEGPVVLELRLSGEMTYVERDAVAGAEPRRCVA